MFNSFKLFDSFNSQIHFEITKPPENEMNPLEQAKRSNNSNPSVTSSDCRACPEQSRRGAGERTFNRTVLITT